MLPIVSCLVLYQAAYSIRFGALMQRLIWPIRCINGGVNSVCPLRAMALMSGIIKFRRGCRVYLYDLHSCDG